MKVKSGDIVVLSPDFSYAEVRSAPGMFGGLTVGLMTSGSLGVVVEVLGSSALEARVLLQDNVVGWVVGSYLRPVFGEEIAKQEMKK